MSKATARYALSEARELIGRPVKKRSGKPFKPQRRVNTVRDVVAHPYFDAEVAKLDRWSDDLKLGLERELKDLDAAIREARKQSAVAVALVDKLTAQREIKTLEQSRNRKRRDLFEEQDRIDEQPR